MNNTNKAYNIDYDMKEVLNTNTSKRLASSRFEGQVTIIEGTPEYLKLMKAFSENSMFIATFVGREFEVFVVDVEKYNDSSYYNSAIFYMVGNPRF